MIRFLDKKNENEIIRLWNIAFGDDESFIRDFVGKIGYNSILGFFQNGKLVSMFCLINAELLFEEESCKAYYLYAACTLPQFRGQGIMGMLIETAAEYAQKIQ